MMGVLRTVTERFKIKIPVGGTVVKKVEKMLSEDVRIYSVLCEPMCQIDHLEQCMALEMQETLNVDATLMFDILAPCQQ